MRDDLRGVLTAEQRATFDANVTAMKERRDRGKDDRARRGVRGARGAGRAPAGR
jgi:hypothetical protein